MPALIPPSPVTPETCDPVAPTRADGEPRGGRQAPAGEQWLVAARLAADVLTVWPPFLIAYACAGAELAHAVEGAAAFAILLVIILSNAGLYRPAPSALGHREIAGVVRGVLAAGAGYGTLLFSFGRPGHPPAGALGAIALSALLVPIGRRAVMAGARALTRSGRLAGRRVLICGAGRVGRLALQQLFYAAVDGRRVVGFVDDALPVGSTVRCRVAQTGVPDVDVPVLGRLEEWARVCAEHAVDVVLVTAPWADPDHTRDVLRRAAALGMRAEFVPDLGGTRVDLLQTEALGAVPVLRVADLSGATSPPGKRVLDVVGAALLITCTAPLWAIAAVLVRATSPGPVFFVQERVGRGGRRFRMYKFRTMRRDADAYAPSPAYDTHPSITRVGRLLRVAGLDELPQLLNVLRGDMSLVGPRPEMPFIVARYTADERQRLYATPGVTGVWQLSPDRQAQIHESVEHDLYYVRHQSLLLDVVVLFETMIFTASLVAARSARRFRPGRRRPAPAAPESRGGGDYTLVALDQRLAPAADRWTSLLPAALAWVPSSSAVRVLAARGNAAAMQAAVGLATADWTPPAGALAYETYRSREQLRVLCEGARLVITDLPHVAEWARGAGVEVVPLTPDGAPLHDPLPPAGYHPWVDAPPPARSPDSAVGWAALVPPPHGSPPAIAPRLAT